MKTLTINNKIAYWGTNNAIQRVIKRLKVTNYVTMEGVIEKL